MILTLFLHTTTCKLPELATSATRVCSRTTACHIVGCVVYGVWIGVGGRSPEDVAPGRVSLDNDDDEDNTSNQRVVERG